MFTDKGALFSDDRAYRYKLWRCWDDSLPQLLIIGFNPSRADEDTEDPTIRRCIGFARDLGFGGLWVGNLFAYCTHDPKVLKAAVDPIGPENDRHLAGMIARSSHTLVAWGNHGYFEGRDQAILELIPRPYCLKVNRSGQPAHPLYLPAGLSLRPYSLTAPMRSG